MRLYIIRHADPNYENDTITDFGKEEARALAKRLSLEGLSKIYCSTMNRAVETMLFTKELLGLEPVMCDWMREVDWSNTIDNYANPWDLPGEFLLNEPDMPNSKNWVSNKYFDAKKVREDLNKRIVFFDEFLLEQGYKREEKHFLELNENHDKIAMFCHAGFGNAIISYLLNIPLTLQWASFWMAPTAVTIILFSKRDNNIVVPKCIAYGDTSHLYESKLKVRSRGLKGDYY